MRVIIDRFEEDKAVLELDDGSMTTAPKILFKGACEGDAVNITIESKSSEKSADTHSIFQKLRNKSNK